MKYWFMVFTTITGLQLMWSVFTARAEEDVPYDVLMYKLHESDRQVKD